MLVQKQIFQLKIWQKKIIKMTNSKIKIKQNIKIFRPALSEVQNLKCNNNKLRKYTNWKQSVDLNSGLKKTIQWINDNKSKYFVKYKV